MQRERKMLDLEEGVMARVNQKGEGCVFGVMGLEGKRYFMIPRRYCDIDSMDDR